MVLLFIFPSLFDPTIALLCYGLCALSFSYCLWIGFSLHAVNFILISGGEVIIPCCFIFHMYVRRFIYPRFLVFDIITNELEVRSRIFEVLLMSYHAYLPKDFIVSFSLYLASSWTRR